jgi:Glycosyl transferases group 1
MRSADVFVFPSVRDFGAGVVFEALASGAVPVVVDFGGPGDIVHPEVGYKLPLTNEDDVVTRMEKVLAELVHNRSLLERLRRQGMTYARERLTWDAKAQDTSRVLHWVLRRGPKPELLPPKIPQLGEGELTLRRVAQQSGTAKRLQSVNALAPTKICRVMTGYGSDKGRVRANPRNQDPSLYHSERNGLGGFS